MEIEPDFMRPVILHCFGTSAKKRLPSHLADLASHGWMPLAAAFYGSAEWKPQWMHHNFLPVIGLRIDAKRLRYRQLLGYGREMTIEDSIAVSSLHRKPGC